MVDSQALLSNIGIAPEDLMANSCHTFYFVNCNKFITLRMRRFTERSIDEFFESLAGLNVKRRFRYLLFMITEVKVVNTKVIKKLVDTDFYELRISVGNDIGRFCLR